MGSHGPATDAARTGLSRMRCEEIDALFQRLAGWSLLEELRKEEDESKVNDTVVVQPAVMAIQISLVKLYEHYGIRPAGVVGHSIGEVAAGYAAGALDARASGPGDLPSFASPESSCRQRAACWRSGSRWKKPAS